MQYETPVVEVISLAPDTAVANEVTEDFGNMISKPIPSA